MRPLDVVILGPSFHVDVKHRISNDRPAQSIGATKDNDLRSKVDFLPDPETLEPIPI
jgi:hypothetical protein